MQTMQHIHYTNFLSPYCQISQNYIYRTSVGVPLLLLAAGLTLVITFITVGYKAYQASVMNPANAIRTE